MAAEAQFRLDRQVAGQRAEAREKAPALLAANAFSPGFRGELPGKKLSL